MWTMEPLAKTTPSRRTLWQLVPQTLRYARFNRHEIAGSLGDLGTFLPLLVGMSAQNGLNFASALFFAGLFNIVTGLTFSIPMAVQPMKAIAAVALTEGLTTPDSCCGSDGQSHHSHLGIIRRDQLAQSDCAPLCGARFATGTGPDTPHEGDADGFGHPAMVGTG